MNSELLRVHISYWTLMVFCSNKNRGGISEWNIFCLNLVWAVIGYCSLHCIERVTLVWCLCSRWCSFNIFVWPNSNTAERVPSAAHHFLWQVEKWEQRDTEYCPFPLCEQQDCQCFWKLWATGWFQTLKVNWLAKCWPMSFIYRLSTISVFFFFEKRVKGIVVHQWDIWMYSLQRWTNTYTCGNGLYLWLSPWMSWHEKQHRYLHRVIKIFSNYRAYWIIWNLSTFLEKICYWKYDAIHFLVLRQR